MTPNLIDAFHQAYYDAAGSTWLNTFWLGIPVQKCPLDLWIYQEILVDTRPSVVVETGTLWGGSALFFASIFDMLGTGRVITIDTQPRPRMPQHKRITYLTGSSTSHQIVSIVRALVTQDDRIMVVLDSAHEAHHVLQEMHTYKSFVSPGTYMVVEDTNINGNPVAAGVGPGPKEAVVDFLKSDTDFVQDRTREKFGLTFFPGGFLRRKPL